MHAIRAKRMKKVEGVKAFFVNDPGRAWYEVQELSQIDRGKKGIITYDDLADFGKSRYA